MTGLARVVDAALELPVGPSFSRLGHAVRSRLGDWRTVDSYDLGGRTALVTGATSGLGLETARQLAANGATVVLLGRDAAKTESVRARLAADRPSAALHTVVADMGDLDAVRAVADSLPVDGLDVLIHNAGALTADRRESPQGIELTVASQVVGPFLLTHLLLDRLRASPAGRVLTMSSGGMYATGLTVDDLQMGADYKGAEQYARAKRAQVTLNEMWAAREPGVVFHAVHPGWADTPGVAESLPTFRRVVGPLLRTPAEGADTLIWLASDDGHPLSSTGGFWLDRTRRSLHKLPSTRRTDTEARRRQLWDWCSRAAGIT